MARFEALLIEALPGIPVPINLQKLIPLLLRLFY
jgi:hypothetical protein